jgi:hypothetical protein
MIATDFGLISGARSRHSESFVESFIAVLLR